MIFRGFSHWASLSAVKATRYKDEGPPRQVNLGVSTIALPKMTQGVNIFVSVTSATVLPTSLILCEPCVPCITRDIFRVYIICFLNKIMNQSAC